MELIQEQQPAAEKERSGRRDHTHIENMEDLRKIHLDLRIVWCNQECYVAGLIIRHKIAGSQLFRSNVCHLHQPRSGDPTER